jgi:hypothetical protein
MQVIQVTEVTQAAVALALALEGRESESEAIRTGQRYGKVTLEEVSWRAASAILASRG